MLKLHLGCNDKRIPGFINIDIMETDAVDFICHLEDIDQYFESVDYIYACHVLEHFSRHSYMNLLKKLHNILKPGGMIRVSVPDFEALVKYYFLTGNLKEIRGTIFGGQRNEFDYHKWGWDYASLSEDLKSLGFLDIKRYDPFQTEHADIRDWSRDYVPRHDNEGNELLDEEWFKGILVSLNVEAKKSND